MKIDGIKILFIMAKFQIIEFVLIYILPSCNFNYL